jgi:hypothetical protein
MVSLIVLIAAGLLTSSSAVLHVPRTTAGAGRWRRLRDNSLWQICAGILALGAILLAVHIDLGTFR